MNSSRRPSSGHNQVGSVTSPSASGVTSVWVGSRPPKEPPRPPPKINNNNNSNNNNPTASESKTEGHWKTRRVSTGTGNGEYVVVSVRNSISEPTSPFGRRNSTILSPMSTTFSANGPFSSSEQISSSSNNASLPTSSAGGLQRQISSSLQTSGGTASKNSAQAWNDLGSVNTIPATAESNFAGNVLSNSQNCLGNSMFGTSSSGSLLTNNSNNNFMNPLYNSAGNLVPPVTPSMNMLPLSSPSLSSLLFPQSCGLSADLLASSFNQTLNLSQLPSLKPSPIFPQTNSLLGLTPSPFLPIPPVGQSQIFPQTNSLLSFPQIPLLPLPSTTPSLDFLSSSFSTNQAVLPSHLQFQNLLPSPALPLVTTTPGISSTETSVPPVLQKLTHKKSPPPLLHQKPSEAFLARRASLKAEEAQKDVRSPKRLSWASQDQEDPKVTPLDSPAPSRRSSSTSLPDSICEADYPEHDDDDDDLPTVTVEPCYDPPYDPQACMRCGKKVYKMEKQVGPVRRVLYHKACFSCVACGTALNLHSYQLNDGDKGDLNLYCTSHKPWVRHRPLDSEALLQQQAVLTLPRPQLCA